MQNSQILWNFIQENIVLLIPYIILISLTLPIESIGYSKYTAQIINTKNINQIKNAMIMIAIIYIATKCLNIGQHYYEAYISTNINKNIRKKLISSYIKNFTENYKEVDVGKIISQLNTIPNLYKNLFDDFLRIIMPYGITIIILAFYFFRIDKRLGCFIVISMILLICICVNYGFHIAQQNINKMKLYYELNQNIQDKLANMYIIVTNNEHNNEIKKNNNQEEIYRANLLKFEKNKCNKFVLLNLLLFLILIGTLCIYFKIFKKEINEHTTASIMTLLYLIKYINITQQYLLEFISDYGVIVNLEQEFKHKYPIQKNGIIKNFINDGNIKISNLNFAYNNKVIHENLSMDFKKNQITLIFGKSGSGKTTLIKLLLGLYSYQGSILIDNIELRDCDKIYYRDNIAFVPQDSKLFNESIYDNIKYGINISNEKIDQTIQMLGANIIPNLHVKAGINGSGLSNGQKQFISLVRAFLKNKKILILDEPTSALDENTKKIVLNVIQKISNDKTVIIVTHDNDLKQISDEIYTLTHEQNI